MKQTTKRILGIAAASALVIGATTGVFARGGFGPGWGGHHGMMGGPQNTKYRVRSRFEVFPVVGSEI